MNIFASYTVSQPSSYGFLIITPAYASVWRRKASFSQSLSEKNSLFKRYLKRSKSLLSGVGIFFPYQSIFLISGLSSLPPLGLCFRGEIVNECEFVALRWGNPSWVIFYSRCIQPITNKKALSLYIDSICLYFQSW